LFVSVVSAGFLKDRLARALTNSPMLNVVDPGNVTVRLGLRITYVEYDPATGILCTTAYLSQSWKDDRLSWDPTDYENLAVLHLPQSLVWTPDILPWNNIGKIEESARVNVIVSSTGDVFWAPPVIYRTLCLEQETGGLLNCQIKLGSWTYSTDQLQLANLHESSEVSFDDGTSSPYLGPVRSASASFITNQYDEYGAFTEYVVTLVLESSASLK